MDNKDKTKVDFVLVTDLMNILEFKESDRLTGCKPKLSEKVQNSLVKTMSLEKL
jgi:hypothetical protein